MKFSLYKFCWDKWYKRAKKRAMRDPVYAAEELGRRKDSFVVGSGTGSDGKEYTLKGMWEHMDHFHKLCPTPWWVKVHHFRDKHRLRIGMKYRDARDFIQRGKRGYSDSDLWSFDTYLSGVISKGLIHLRDTTHGYPTDMCEKCCFGEEHECHGFEDWQNILTEISEAFAQDKFSSKEFDQERFDKAMALFTKHFHNFWD